MAQAPAQLDSLRDWKNHFNNLDELEINQKLKNFEMLLDRSNLYNICGSMDFSVSN